MMFHFISFVYLAFVSSQSLSYVTALPVRSESSQDSLQLKTSSGTVVGLINGTTPGVRQFLGVPYAQPPVDKLRWLPPAAILSNQSSQVIVATQFSQVCPQYVSAIPSVFTTIVPQFTFEGSGGEDCLTASIWTPTNITKPVPVFIWLHGGGFQVGGSSVSYENPAQWVQRTQSHIVVGIQYRLNIFGFPNAAALSSQNLGFLDQRMGIEWVRDNIAAFGGDVNKMILWGQSAGASSTDVQNFAFSKDPIVQGFISDSGSAFMASSFSQDVTHTNFTFVAKHFNCSGDAVSELDCMQSVASDDIEAFLKLYQDSQVAPLISFGPIVDNLVVFSNYTEQILAGKVSDKPSIFGTNANDGLTFAPLPTNFNTTSPNVTIGEEIEDRDFLCGIVENSVFRNEIGRTTYRFQYRGNFTNVSPVFWLGAYHSSELPLIFGTEGNFRGPATAFEVATSREMQDLWLDFAEDPVNGLTQVGWTDYSRGLLNVFGGQNAQGQNEVMQLISVAEVDNGACSFIGLNLSSPMP